MVTVLQNAINFFRDFGLFDVVLPFLLVFAIVFAILEKTRILGNEGSGDKAVPKHSLNSTVAFVVALLVVATNKVVTAINAALPNVVLLVVLLVSFLLVLGVFYKEGDFDFSEKYQAWTKVFAGLIFAAILLIFADSIEYSGQQSWLDFVLDYVIQNYSSTVVGAIVMLIILVGAVLYITRGMKIGKEEK